MVSEPGRSDDDFARADVPFRLQSEVIDLLLSGAETQEILDQVCRIVEEGIADGICSYMALDEDGDRLWVRAAPSLPAEAREAVDGLWPGELAGSCGTAVFTGESVYVGDTTIDARWQDMRDFARRFGVHAAWSVPVFGAQKSPQGSFAISRFVPGAPTAVEQTLLATAGHIVDLVSMREAEDRATNDRDQLIRAVVESADEGICVRDTEGRFVFMNEAGAKMLGVASAVAMGKSPRDYFSDKALEESQRTDQVVISTGESITATFRNRWNGEDDRVTQVRKYPRFGAEGKVIGVISISRDVTEIDRTERAVQQAQKIDSLGMLAGGIAHDFNNILVGILGNSEWAYERAAGDVELQASLRDIRQAALRAKALTKQILSYAGAPSTELELVDLRELLREVLDLSAGALGNRTKVRLHLPENLPRVDVDATQIHQVMMNLLVNASDALEGEEGRIEVEVDECRISDRDHGEVIGDRLAEGHYVRVRIVDDGAGMSEETCERIFDPFFSTKSSGRGLGLASVPGILRAHHGGIRVSSNPGEGSVFEFFLPLSDKPSSTKQRAGCPTALVVDDESFVRKTTRRLLETAGWNVFTAADTVEAERLLEEGQFDLALLDVNLPGTSGIEFSAVLRDRFPETPYLLSTGGMSDVGRELHGASVLRKPFTRDELLDAVDRTRRQRA